MVETNGCCRWLVVCGGGGLLPPVPATAATTGPPPPSPPTHGQLHEGGCPPFIKFVCKNLWIFNPFWTKICVVFTSKMFDWKQKSDPNLRVTGSPQLQASAPEWKTTPYPETGFTEYSEYTSHMHNATFVRDKWQVSLFFFNLHISNLLEWLIFIRNPIWTVNSHLDFLTYAEISWIKNIKRSLEWQAKWSFP